jgi:prepilin-type N-terminal cleavage/methylation domain-containing protein
MNPTLRCRLKSGFTLVEVMCASLLLGAVIVMAMSSFSYVTQSDSIESAQGDLDLDARQLVERLRRDLWRTSRDEILLYPPGDGPYTAISFPILFTQNETNSVPRNADGSIRWDATVIYHLWSGTPPEVRRTVFSPRMNLSPTDRASQLANTVTSGTGSGTHNGNNAHTQRMISNLVDWRLNTSGPRFDGYAATPGRRQANLGTAKLSDGLHDFTFRITGRNSRSSGYRAGIDWLSVSPSGSPREAEAQILVSASGATPALVLNTGGTWSGNYMLGFAGGVNSEFTLRMESDRWEERNFFHTSMLMDDNLEIFFDTSVTPHTFALRLVGNTNTWVAANQTGGAGLRLDDAALDYTAVRVLLRGSNLLEDGGFIAFNGTNVWARFRNGAILRNLRVREPYIAESDPASPLNYRAGTRRPILFSGANEIKISPGTAADSDALSYHIVKTNSYVVGFLAAHPGESAPVYWHAWTSAPTRTHMYLRRATDDTAALANHRADTWAVADAAPVNAVYALESVRAGHAPEGTYQSRIIDTRKQFPEYRTFGWTASTPENSAVELRLRTGAQPDLSDAPAWESATAPANDGQLYLNGRYAQIQAKLRPGGTNATTTAVLRDYTLRWEAEPRSVDLGGVFSTGPDHGIVEVLVDGKPLIQAVTVDLEVYKEITLLGGKRRRFEASAFSEIVPRNTRALLNED